MSFDLRLTAYKQTIELVPNGATFEPVLFDQLDPVLIKKKKNFRVLRQSGAATAWQAQFVAPVPVIGSPTYLEQPQIKIERISALEWQTTWNYVMAVPDDVEINNAQIRDWEAYPEAPIFES